MSKHVEQNAVWERGKRSALRTWGLYLLSLTAWVTAVVALAVLGMVVCGAVTWYDTPLYRFLNWVRDYIFFVGMAVVLLGWVVISYFFIARPVRDLELLLAGAEQLTPYFLSFQNSFIEIHASSCCNGNILHNFFQSCNFLLHCTYNSNTFHDL